MHADTEQHSLDYGQTDHIASSTEYQHLHMRLNFIRFDTSTNQRHQHLQHQQRSNARSCNNNNKPFNALSNELNRMYLRSI